MRISDWSSDVCSSDLHDVPVPVERAVVVVWRGVEHQVVGHLAEVAAEQQQRIAQRAPDGHDIGGGGMLEVPAVGARDHQHLVGGAAPVRRSEEHTSELQSLMRLSYAVFFL